MADKYHRLVCLIMNICTEPLRELFLKLSQSDPKMKFVDLQSYLGLRKTEICSLKRSKILRNDQCDLLYPTNGNPDVANWDVTLLVALIKNLFKNRLVPTEKSSLEEIRNIRNTLLHVADTSQMPDATFDDFWNRLQTASTTLANQVSGSTYKDGIEKKIQAARSNNMPDLGDALRKFYEEDRKQLLVDQKQLLANQKQISRQLTSVKQKIRINERWKRKRIMCLQTKTDKIDANSAESNSVLRKVTVSKYGRMGEKVKRLKAVDEILSGMKRKFQSTMSQLPEDFLPTDHVLEIKDKLKQQHHVIVSGSRGSRYLDTVLRAILDIGYITDRCVEMTEASEWRHIDPEEVDLVLCRSPIGNDIFDSYRANTMYLQFDSILYTVKHRCVDEKRLDFVLVTNGDILRDFKTTRDHELVEDVVELFAKTSTNCPEDLTGNKCREAFAVSRRDASFSRQLTDIYLDKYLRIANNIVQEKVSSAKTKLKENKSLLISGPPKSGKTALAVSLAASYERESVLFLFSPSEVHKIDISSISLAIIDEFVDKIGFDKANVREWFRCFKLLYLTVRAGKLNAIIVCKTENLRRCLEEIGEHPMLSDPFVLSRSALMIKQEHVSRADAANGDVLGTGQHTSNFSSTNRARYMKSISQYYVKKRVDSGWWIEGCCMLPNDEILLLDNFNSNLKKLDASYCVTSTYELGDIINMFDLTNVTYIGNSEAVVCAKDILVYVNVSGNMSVRKTVKLDTDCKDVSCRNDSLYVLYDTSIHICTLEGNTVSVLHLEMSGGNRIAVAEDGQMYIASSRKELISLDNSGNVINTLQIVPLHYLCVDDRGNVWAAGSDKKVYQISADGAQILNTLLVNMVGSIRSLCYDNNRSALVICRCPKITVIGLNSNLHTR